MLYIISIVASITLSLRLTLTSLLCTACTSRISRTHLHSPVHSTSIHLNIISLFPGEIREIAQKILVPLAVSPTALSAVLGADPLALLAGLGLDPGPELRPKLGLDSTVPMSAETHSLDSSVSPSLSTLLQSAAVGDAFPSPIERTVRRRISTYSGIAVELAGDLMAYQYLQLRTTGCCAPSRFAESETATTSLLFRAVSAMTWQIRSATLTPPRIHATPALLLQSLKPLSRPSLAPQGVLSVHGHRASSAEAPGQGMSLCPSLFCRCPMHLLFDARYLGPFPRQISSVESTL